MLNSHHITVKVIWSRMPLLFLIPTYFRSHQNRLLLWFFSNTHFYSLALTFCHLHFRPYFYANHLVYIKCCLFSINSSVSILFLIMFIFGFRISTHTLSSDHSFRLTTCSYFLCLQSPKWGENLRLDQEAPFTMKWCFRHVTSSFPKCGFPKHNFPIFPIFMWIIFSDFFIRL